VSLFAYPWSWTDEGGNRLTFARWRGSPIVVTAVYTQCVRTCPFTIEKLHGVEQAFRSRGRAAEFVLVTLDPAADTPPRLAEFKASRRLPTSWHLVVGSPEQTQEFTDLLDLHVFGADAHIIHDSRIMVFDERGTARKRFTCCDFTDAEAIP
jgi:protein SCO1/2